MLLRIALAMSLSLLVVSATPAKTYHHPGGLFKVTYDPKEFSQEDARDLAEGLTTAWFFYTRNGFVLPPTKLTVKLKEKSNGLLGGYNPLSRNLKIFVPVDKKTGRRTGRNATREQRRFTAAHELFHAAFFRSFPSGRRFAFERYWVAAATKWGKVRDEDEAAEFWLLFEGLAETMAWMVFPEIGADPGDGELGHAYFWYAQTMYNSEIPSGLPNEFVCGDYPHTFVNPWKIKPHCTVSTSLEAASYYTLPFWLRVAQQVGGPPVNGSYDGPAQAIRELLEEVVHQADVHKRVPEAVTAGINTFLRRHELKRRDIRNLMSLSAGIERFGDETPRAGNRDRWTAHFRDFEQAGNEVENRVSHLSWALDYQLEPPMGQTGNTIDFFSLLTNLEDEPGRLESFNYDGSAFAADAWLPAFAGDEQGINNPTNHPLDTTVVPPAVIELIDLSPDPPELARPTIIAGYRHPGSTLFTPRIVTIEPGDRPTPLALNNFRLRDLSVLRVLSHSSHLKYRYRFLDMNQSRLGFGQTHIQRPEQGEWLIREVRKPNNHHPSRHRPSATIMLTPATIPVGEPDPVTNAWTDIDIFDVVARLENTTTGAWTSTRSDTNTHVAVVAFPGNDNERVRVDIARFKPGNHGGGYFHLTGALRKKDDPEKPDLLVRANDIRITGDGSPRPPDDDDEPDPADGPGCKPTLRFKSYITNQGNDDAFGVVVRAKGSLVLRRGKTLPSQTFNFDHRFPAQNYLRGETRLVEVEIESPINGYRAALEGKVIIDSDSLVDEAVESNNESHFIVEEQFCR